MQQAREHADHDPDTPSGSCDQTAARAIARMPVPGTLAAPRGTRAQRALRRGEVGRMGLKRRRTLVFLLCLSNGLGICWTTAGLAGEQAPPALAAPLLFPVADRFPAAEPLGVADAPVISPASMHTAAGEANRDEWCGHVLRAVRAMSVLRSTSHIPDLDVGAAAGLDPAGILPGVQSPVRSSAELADVGSVLFGRPRLGGMTLDGDFPSTAAEKSLPAHRQH